MESIWMAIAPDATSTKVLAMAGAQDTILKARLSRSPSHPRAMASLLEAIALWQGLPHTECGGKCAGHMGARENARVDSTIA